jgi:arabinose-5-phosphate isomerase
MAIGVALAAVWMEGSGISPEQFAIDHRACALGRQLILTLADLIVPAMNLVLLVPMATLVKVIKLLTQSSLSRGALGAAIVFNQYCQLCSLIADSDFGPGLKRQNPSKWHLLAEACITNLDLFVVSTDAQQSMRLVLWKSAISNQSVCCHLLAL